MIKKYLVWDLPVRLFHWLLVLCLLAQWLTAEIVDDALWLHFYVGYFTLGLIIFRLLWGFLGTKYAKFSQILAGPKAIYTYIANLGTGQEQKVVGHNALGGWMLPAVLLLVAIQAITGLFSTDDVLSQGPYYSVLNSEWQNTLQWLHANTYYLIFALAIIHILAILSYKFILKTPLTKAMLDGKKPVRQSDAISHSKLITALTLAILVGLFIYWLVAINPPPIEAYYF